MAAGVMSPSAMADDVWEAFSNHSPTVPSSPSTKTTSASSSSSTTSSSGASTASTAAASSALSCRCRRSTSDLTDLIEEEDLVSLASASSVASVRGPGYSSRPTSPSPGSHRGSRTGLAYLASRRGSRDSQASEDLGPLAFAQSSRATRRRTSNFLELPVADHIRPRVCSLPESAFNPRGSSDESAFYRLRTFSTTNKGGVVNRGDALISRRHRSKSNTSVNSTASRHSNASGVSPGERSPFEGSCCGSSYVSSEGSMSGMGGEEEETPKYRVVLLGDSGVGKTALVSQFMTSEYMNTYDASLDDEFGEKTVSVLLDGEESEMVFIDHPSVEMSVSSATFFVCMRKRNIYQSCQEGGREEKQRRENV
ncbi:uncharacterized serine-rich protein C215.13-like [Ischnura elegans]|uniref:uncharacterized serine-rich protein C215.13-like n=1 Tax=Ischnura elegans TaxID=197161 RepID=UPI001ED8AB32|nr:uncharacterized serine-rich protein C215.13-like [Ischnura elegans]